MSYSSSTGRTAMSTKKIPVDRFQTAQRQVKLIAVDREMGPQLQAVTKPSTMREKSKGPPLALRARIIFSKM